MIRRLPLEVWHNLDHEYQKLRLAEQDGGGLLFSQRAWRDRWVFSDKKRRAAVTPRRLELFTLLNGEEVTLGYDFYANLTFPEPRRLRRPDEPTSIDDQRKPVGIVGGQRTFHAFLNALARRTGEHVLATYFIGHQYEGKNRTHVHALISHPIAPPDGMPKRWQVEEIWKDSTGGTVTLVEPYFREAHLRELHIGGRHARDGGTDRNGDAVVYVARHGNVHVDVGCPHKKRCRRRGGCRLGKLRQTPMGVAL